MVHRMLRPLIASALLVVIGGCSGGDDDDWHDETIELAAHQTVCSGAFPQLCYLTRQPGASAWTLQYAGISGLRYEWGHQYTLRVRVKTRSVGGMQDTSPVSYELLAVQSNTELPHNTVYQIELRPAQWLLTKGTDGVWRLLDRLPIACQPAVCADLEALVAAQPGTVLTFDHTNSPAGPMNLLTAVAKP